MTSRNGREIDFTMLLDTPAFMNTAIFIGFYSLIPYNQLHIQTGKRVVYSIYSFCPHTNLLFMTDDVVTAGSSSCHNTPLL